MRHRLGLLGATTSLLLAAAVVVAGPAEARRNVGGFVPEVCVAPGNAVLGNPEPGPGAVQICFTDVPKGADVVIAVPKGK